MHSYLGIIFALVALFGWGFGDFLAQRGIKKIGIWKALFIGDMVGFVIFLPFIWKDFSNLNQQTVILLILSGIVYTFASLFYFFALDRGKIALLEPMNGLEILVTVGLGITIGKESLSLLQFISIFVALIGIVLAVTIHHTHLHYHKRLLEKGVILAGVGAIGMALSNFLVGTSSHQMSPVLIVWFIHAAITLQCFIYLAYQKQLKSVFSLPARTFRISITSGLFNNAGWLGFAFSTTFIPISVATTISEGYIALVVMLGIFVNREKLQKHQIVGVILAIIGVLALSFFSSK
jgi:drug/metabolite transporter (DMT)-like permease